MTTRETTPPALLPTPQAPTAKEKKYDRQLRLWAANGQAALENAKILLLNSGPGVAGIETLKNLILPGVGSFTIVDEAVVEEQDLGVNFFLEADSLGKSRAKECARLLTELNPEVQGNGIRSETSTFLFDTQVQSYSLIILNGPSLHLQALSDQCWSSSVPLFYVHSLGFYSHFSVQLPSQFPIIDTHPDPLSTQDLRLLTPWPELVHHARSATHNLEHMANHEHGHIPWLLLILHFLEIWKKSHAGEPPKNYSEKKEFKALIEAAARTGNPEGGEENFEEAAAAVLKSLNPPSISGGVSEVFKAEECTKPTATSQNFWIIAHGIKAFHDAHDQLPLPGSVPDMKAQSADYIRLQNIYKSKARLDLAEVVATIRSLEASLGRTASIDEREIEAFCKGAASVKLIKGRPIRFAPLSKSQKPKMLEDLDWTDVAGGLSLELQMQDESLLPVYIAFLAYDQYQLQKRSQPKEGEMSDFVEPASIYANGAIKSLASTAGLGGLDVTTLEEKAKNVLLEFDRAGGGELHNIAALTGGMVAQEVIKVVTKQYIPVDNACVFDGVVSKTSVFKT